MEDNPEEEGDNMSNLIVFSLENEDDAERMAESINNLQKQGIIRVVDGTVAVRGQDGKIKIKQSQNLEGVDSIGGAFLAPLMGLLIITPLIAAVGVIMALSSDAGIDEFLKEVGESIEPGDSALFLLVKEWSEEKTINNLSNFDFEFFQTNISEDDEGVLREAISGIEGNAPTEPPPPTEVENND